MPLIIPNNLPAKKSLEKENIFTMNCARALSQDIRPLEILVVNLMPTKIATETQLARVLANTPLQVELTLLKMNSHKSKNTSQEHMDCFYTVFDKIKDNKYDGMIITGAPVENINFEDVDYWEELKTIFEFSKTNVFSTLHICWGAQAGLYYHFGINKNYSDSKIFGVFENKVLDPFNCLLRGFDDFFYVPHSRHTFNKIEDIKKHPEIKVLASSEEVGPHILSVNNGNQIYLMGHQEYDKDTLAKEYFRDIDKGMNIDIPKNYFKNDDPKDEILFRWRSHANLFFGNWLNYIYQDVDYNFTL